jgi:hypothetical protein
MRFSPWYLNFFHACLERLRRAGKMQGVLQYSGQRHAAGRAARGTDT